MSKQRIPMEKIMDLPIIDVARHFGMNVVRKGRTYKALCPAHSDSNIGSMEISARKGCWYCFACGSGGTVVNLVAYFLDIEWKEALDLIAKEYSVEPRAMTEGEVLRAKSHITPEEYEFLGFKGAYEEHEDANGEMVTFRIKDDPELHDAILRGKLVEKCLSVYETVDRILDSGELQRLLNIPLDELPLLLDSAREETLKTILEIAERGFIDRRKNPFPSPKAYRKKLEQRLAESKDRFEVTLASQVS